MRAIGIILAGGRNNKLNKLTKRRVSSAIPIASTYRAIDFSLSNMAHSSIHKVAVITQYNSSSLNDHLSSSKWWNFGRKQGGLFVLTPHQSDEQSLFYRGTADSLYQNLSFLEKSNEEYVVITNGECIYKMDYNNMIKHHIAKGADISVAYKEATTENLNNHGVMLINADGRIIEFEEKPLEPQYNTISIAVYVISRVKLIEYITLLHSEGRYDFVNDLIIRYRKRLKIYGYKFDSYWKPVNSIQNYFDINMDFLTKEVRDHFTKEPFPLLTKPKDQPPVKYNYGAFVKNSSIGNGSIVSGSVTNSVLFRSVIVSEGSSVNNSIILEGCHIESGCKLEYVIIDKYVSIGPGTSIIGTKDDPITVEKNTTL